MGRPRRLVILLGAAAAAAAVVRHRRGTTMGRRVPGGILIGDAVVYDTLTRLVLGSFYGGIAADVAAAASPGARVLEVGCGPGHLSNRLARRNGLEVTGLDLDPAMSSAPEPTPTARGTATSADRRSWSATRPPWHSPTTRSTWPSARCRCTTGPTRRPAWPRSAACCAPAAARSSGTSGPASGPIHSAHATRTRPTRSNTPVAPRFESCRRRHGAGPGGSPSPSGSSWPASTTHPGAREDRATSTRLLAVRESARPTFAVGKPTWPAAPAMPPSCSAGRWCCGSCSSPWTKGQPTAIRCARCPRPGGVPTPNKSWTRPSAGPSPRRRPVVCSLSSRCSGGTTCCACSAPGCGSGNWPGCVAAASTWTAPCPSSRSSTPATRPAGSAAASNPGPRATPASASSPGTAGGRGHRPPAATRQ